MNSISTIIQTSVLFCVVSLATFAQIADAQNVIEKHAEVLSTYVTDDVVAVVYFDLEHLDLEQAINAADAIGFSKKELLFKLVDATPQINSEIAKFKSAGVTAAFGLLRMTDLDTMDSTSWVFPVNAGKGAANAAAAVKGLKLGNLPTPFSMVDSAPGVVLACGNERQMTRLKQDAPANKRSLDDAASGLGASSIGLLVIGSEDSKRAIRELLPPMPEPFSAMTGGLLADQTNWLGVSLTLNKDIGGKVVVEATDEAAAKQYAALAGDAMKLVMSLPGSDDFIPTELKSTLLDGLSPEQTGKCVVISTDKLMSDRDRLTKMLSPAIKSAQSLAARKIQQNTLRTIVLASHNYESAYEHFPTQAIVDANGKPLLSWRVAILPFIDQDVYKEFHLDEPWDSEHNLKLVKKMPAIYRDAGPDAFQNNQDGKTIFLGAAGEGLMFNGSTEVTFGDMTDGTSNTILFAAVAAEHAVPWTQPVDWQVDLQNPTAQLIEGNRTHANVAVGDGSVQSLRLNMNSKNWSGLLTIGGGEIVTDW